jgi:hypothetical protein
LLLAVIPRSLGKEVFLGSGRRRMKVRSGLYKALAQGGKVVKRPVPNPFGSGSIDKPEADPYLDLAKF